MSAQILTQHTLKELLHYDPETGVFTWKKRDRKWFTSDKIFKLWNIRFSGETAGGFWKGKSTTYKRISVLDSRYPSHRLAWLYMNGEFPNKQIDHIDGDGTNNSYKNIRSVTPKINGKNKALLRNNKSGYHGIHFDKHRGKWAAEIKVNRKKIFLGRFANKHKAIAVRKAAEAMYGFSPSHGREKWIY